MKHFEEGLWSNLRSDFVAGWRTFAMFDALYKLLMLAVYAPISAWFFNAILTSTGDSAVSNYDLISFFTSAQGVLLIVAFATASFALLFLELGGLVLISVGVAHDKKISAVRTVQFIVARFAGLVRLGFRQFLIQGAVVAIALTAIAFAKATFLGSADIYYYLNVKPPEFWIAVSIAALVSAIAVAGIIVLSVRWMFAVPLMLLRDVGPRHALQESRLLLSDIGLIHVVKSIAVWFLGILAITVVAGAIHSILSVVLVWIAGNKVAWVVGFAGLLAAIDGALGMVIAFLTVVTFASVVARLFLANQETVSAPVRLVVGSMKEDQTERWRFGSFVISCAIILILVAGTVVYSIADRIKLDHKVAVTAHRGSSIAAPENSMAAILQAIKDGADYAEIDVQETADGVVVVIHDTDLRRLAGVNKGVWEVPFEDLRELDVGRWFSDEFADTRIASLEEVVAAVKGKMKLNIEMKFNGHDKQLEAEVARIVRENEFEDECIVTSLEFSGVQEIARHDPRLRRGLIVTATLGEVTNLDVEVLAVNANAVNRDLITRAHRAGMEVHVWTVNEPAQMLTMIHLGVDNIMTDAPEVLVELQKARNEMGDTEKTLLYVHDFMRGRL